MFQATFNDYWYENMFSGPVDGKKKLPSAKRIKGTKNILVGYAGKPGCFSAQQADNGYVDIGLYDQDPKTVAIALANGGLDAAYVSVPRNPGWGFAAINLLRAYLADQ